MDNFNFKEELEDQKKELVEQYGEQIAAYHWNGEEWQLNGNKVEYPEGHFVGGLTPEDDD